MQFFRQNRAGKRQVIVRRISCRTFQPATRQRNLGVFILPGVNGELLQKSAAR